MVKHNNQISNQHFRKDWQRFVKTWFDQPAKKKRRREHRRERAASLAPRPTSLLRPIVRCQTLKYNTRVRLGRGFTLAELKAAEISPKFARSIGIAVDHRRVNASEESFEKNVERLNMYKSKLVLFPVKKDKPTGLESGKADVQAVLKNPGAQNTEKNLFDGGLKEKKSKKVQKMKLIEIPDGCVYGTLRLERMNARLKGFRKRRAELEAKEAKSGGKKGKKGKGKKKK